MSSCVPKESHNNILFTKMITHIVSKTAVQRFLTSDVLIPNCAKVVTTEWLNTLHNNYLIYEWLGHFPENIGGYFGHPLTVLPDQPQDAGSRHGDGDLVHHLCHVCYDVFMFCGLQVKIVTCIFEIKLFTFVHVLILAQTQDYKNMRIEFPIGSIWTIQRFERQNYNYNNFFIVPAKEMYNLIYFGELSNTWYNSLKIYNHFYWYPPVH